MYVAVTLCCYVHSVTWLIECRGSGFHVFPQPHLKLARISTIPCLSLLSHLLEQLSRQAQNCVYEVGQHCIYCRINFIFSQSGVVELGDTENIV